VFVRTRLLLVARGAGDTFAFLHAARSQPCAPNKKAICRSASLRVAPHRAGRLRGFLDVASRRFRASAASPAPSGQRNGSFFAPTQHFSGSVTRRRVLCSPSRRPTRTPRLGTTPQTLPRPSGPSIQLLASHFNASVVCVRIRERPLVGGSGASRPSPAETRATPPLSYELLCCLLAWAAF
jgi:hypothetical protein